MPRLMYPVLLLSCLLTPIVVSWYESGAGDSGVGCKTTTSFPASEFDAIVREIQSLALARKFLEHMERDLFWRIWDARQSHDKEVVFGLALSVSEIDGLNDGALRAPAELTGFVKTEAVAAVLQARNGQDALRILRTLRFFSADFMQQASTFVDAGNNWFQAEKAAMVEEHEIRFGEHAKFLVSASQLSRQENN